MDFRLPELGEGVYEVELTRWLVRPGDKVVRGQNLMEVMTDKATMEVPSPFHGQVESLAVEPGQNVKIGAVVLSYSGGQDGNGESTKQVPVPANRPAQEAGEPKPVAFTAGHVRAGPSVRLMARKLGVDLGRVAGTGPGGRILLADLTATGATPSPKPANVAPAEYGVPGSRQKLLGLRRKIAEKMALSKKTIPHYSYVDEVDVTRLVQTREELRESSAKAGVKLTYLAFIVRAVCAALKETPLVNASLDEAAGEIVFHDRYNIGIAVATPEGLLVPVIHDADRLDLLGIAREIERLGQAARARTCRVEDLRGGTFTVTSIGGIGGLISTPVVNPPEVGILGVGKIVKRPVYDDVGNIKPADMLYLSFSFDHRVVDGAVGAVFGNAVARQLAAPVSMLLPNSSASR